MTVLKWIGVLGVGNVLMGNDGGGPYAVKILDAHHEFPPNVLPHDLGTAGPGITSFFGEFSGNCPREVLLVGVVPKTTEMSCSLTEEKDAVVSASSALLAELHRPVLDPRPHAHAAITSIWWAEKVVSECDPGEAPYVPGYPG